MEQKIFTTGFLLFILLNSMSYKFFAGVVTGYVLSHRDEFSEYRDIIEPYTDPYLDMAAEKIKDIKHTFDIVSKEKVVVKDDKSKSYMETISEKFKSK